MKHDTDEMGAVVAMAEVSYSYEIAVVTSERKRPLGRPTKRWKDNS
jgi:hypothetical protein